MDWLDRYTAFADGQLIARGSLNEIVHAAHAARNAALLVFNDSTGRQQELDLRGDLDAALARLPSTPSARPARGRPKLGVTAREVTLLPRHWEWLATQPGGASAALRRLVDQARKDNDGADAARQAQEAVYRVMTVLAGDLPHYEDAIRALFANNLQRLAELAAAWPQDIRAYVSDLTAQIGGSQA
jgi:hypothetical protein